MWFVANCAVSKFAIFCWACPLGPDGRLDPEIGIKVEPVVQVGRGSRVD